MSPRPWPPPPGGCCSGFGELALLYSAPRAATVRAAADGKLWVMERGVYTAIKLTYQQQLAAEKRALVLRVPLLAVLAPVRWLSAPCTSENPFPSFVLPCCLVRRAVLPPTPPLAPAAGHCLCRCHCRSTSRWWPMR